MTDYAGNKDVDMEREAVPVSAVNSSSKIDSIMHNLIQLDQKRHRDGKGIKSLVFSRWKTTLDALGQTLSGSDMQYARIDGNLTLN
ncbi:hypothetical protein N7G274_006150 [Stereocaulon virgatum]|uniref:Uncharacterized protein n=1 Tax=Stereocaulon virgatum TaxID=373712 RepID=A0ABR4A7Y4_9LECA